MLIIRGTSGPCLLGSVEEKGVICPFCGQNEAMHFEVYGKYSHRFWIPFIPLKGKEVFAVCPHCKKKFSYNEMDSNMQTLADQAKKQKKYRWWMYIGFTIFVLPLILLMLFVV